MYGAFVDESGDLTADHSVSWVDWNKNRETRTFPAATLAAAKRIKEEKEKDKDISDVQIHSEGLYAVLDGTGNVQLGMRIDAAKAARNDLRETVKHDEEAREKIELIPMLEYYKRQYPKEWQAAQVNNGRT